MGPARRQRRISRLHRPPACRAGRALSITGQPVRHDLPGSAIKIPTPRLLGRFGAARSDGPTAPSTGRRWRIPHPIPSGSATPAQTTPATPDRPPITLAQATARPGVLSIHRTPSSTDLWRADRQPVHQRHVSEHWQGGPAIRTGSATGRSLLAQAGSPGPRAIRSGAGWDWSRPVRAGSGRVRYDHHRLAGLTDQQWADRADANRDDQQQGRGVAGLPERLERDGRGI